MLFTVLSWSRAFSCRKLYHTHRLLMVATMSREATVFKPCWRYKTHRCVERGYKEIYAMKKEIIRDEKKKFFHPPARTSFLSMLLLFPYFLCCLPSPPCRAALHAGACWPWRPTRYCQPIFHTFPFVAYKFSCGNMHLAWTLTSFLRLHLCLSTFT